MATATVERGIQGRVLLVNAFRPSDSPTSRVCEYRLRDRIGVADQTSSVVGPVFYSGGSEPTSTVAGESSVRGEARGTTACFCAPLHLCESRLCACREAGVCPVTVWHHLVAIARLCRDWNEKGESTPRWEESYAMSW